MTLTRFESENKDELASRVWVNLQTPISNYKNANNTKRHLTANTKTIYGILSRTGDVYFLRCKTEFSFGIVESVLNEGGHQPLSPDPEYNSHHY